MPSSSVPSGFDARTKPLLLCFSHLRWDSVMQRPHHLMRHASGAFQVVFWEEPVFGDQDVAVPGVAVPGEARLAWRETAEGTVVATPVLPRGLDQAACDAQQVRLLDELVDGQEVGAAWFYTPMMLPVAGHLRPQVSVFDCMDELSAFQGASPQLLLLERRLLRQCDLVFTGGRSLHAAKAPLHPDVHLFPSSVDAAHFGRARGGLPVPADQAGVPGPRIGFHGVIDERMDMGLLAGLAERRPDWHFVLVGPIVKIDPAGVPRRPNIHWVGPKAYGELPSYLTGWEAGFMPFALNEATRFISPTKTPEFLAAGVPVVSSAVADVVRDYGRDGLVEIASGVGPWVEALERVMTRPRGPWLARVDARLQRTSWASTWAQMQGLIEDAQGLRKKRALSGERHRG